MTGVSITPRPVISIRTTSPPLRKDGGFWKAPQPVVVPVSNQVQTSVTSLPDLRGYGAREAVHELARLGLTPRVRGSGIVVDQQPDPGAPIEPGTTCTLVLDRDPHGALVPGVPR